MNAFCDPPITTSSPQPSISSGMVPRPVIASTTKIASVFLTARPIAFTSCAAPVDVSEACTNTPLMFLFCASAASTASGFTTSPYGAVSTVAFMPHAFMISTQRSPNFPAEQTSTSSPGVKKFCVAASRPPEPDDTSTITSFEVPITSCKPDSTCLYSLRKSSVRWWMSEPIMAWSAEGRRGVGPGVNKRCFRMYMAGDTTGASVSIKCRKSQDIKRSCGPNSMRLRVETLVVNALRSGLCEDDCASSET